MSLKQHVWFNLIIGLSMTSTVLASGYDSILKSVSTTQGKHGFCYTEPKDKTIEGSNVDGKVRLASVTKLLTSYWAIKRLGPDYRFKTEITYDRSTGRMHIDGDSDAFFGFRRLHFLISELNQRGINEIRELSLGKKFAYFRGIDQKANYHAEYISGIDRDLQVKNLKAGLNVGSWTRSQESSYESTYSEAKDRGLGMIPLNKLSLKVNEVQFVNSNPLRGAAQVETLVSQSPPLRDYLKYINMFSINYPADLLFDFLGGERAFAAFIKKDLGLTADQIKIYEGSGLPRHSPDRLDGYSTCRSVVQIMTSMEKQLQEYGYDLKDVMMIAGVDRGTLGAAYATETMKASTVAKTGTINSAITLSGYINTEEGKVFFGIFFQTSSLSSARAARDRLVRELAMNHGGAKANKTKGAFAFVPFDSKAKLSEVQTSGRLN